jgi:hypothetical protein
MVRQPLSDSPSAANEQADAMPMMKNPQSGLCHIWIAEPPYFSRELLSLEVDGLGTFSFVKATVF